MKKDPYSKMGRRMRRVRKQQDHTTLMREGLARLRKTVSKFFHDGEYDWKPEDVMEVMGYATEIYNKDLLLYLKVWEQEGYIKIVDTSECLFRCLKPFEEES